MRYVLVFLGGIIAGVLLFLLMQAMVANDAPPIPPKGDVVIVLPKVIPPETPPVTSEPRKAPEPPKGTPRPDTPTIPVEPTPEPNPVDPDTTVATPGVKGIDIAIPKPGSYQPGGQAYCSIMIAPVYPRAAARSGTEGKVELAFTIRPDGSVADIEVLSATPRGVFEQAATRAVAKWHCAPAMVDGKPMAKRASQTIEFQLSDE